MLRADLEVGFPMMISSKVLGGKILGWKFRIFWGDLNSEFSLETKNHEKAMDFRRTSGKNFPMLL